MKKNKKYDVWLTRSQYAVVRIEATDEDDAYDIIENKTNWDDLDWENGDCNANVEGVYETGDDE